MLICARFSFANGKKVVADTKSLISVLGIASVAGYSGGMLGTATIVSKAIENYAGLTWPHRSPRNTLHKLRPVMLACHVCPASTWKVGVKSARLTKTPICPSPLTPRSGQRT